MVGAYFLNRMRLPIVFIPFYMSDRIDFIYTKLFYIFLGRGQYTGTNPKINFSMSKRGGQLLFLDGLKYFRNNENRTNLFWRCHWYYRRIRCPVLICMNKFDPNDFRQIHRHCHIKTEKRQQNSSAKNNNLKTY